MQIALDAMGGDYAPGPIVAGAVEAVAADPDLRVVLVRPEIPRARIGKAQLGRTAWLAPTKGGADAEDFRLRTIVGWRLDQPRGAA